MNNVFRFLARAGFAFVIAAAVGVAHIAGQQGPPPPGAKPLVTTYRGRTIVGFPPRRLDHYVPCRGSGPWAMGSVHPTYKDCSKPDLRKASTEKWVEAK